MLALAAAGQTFEVASVKSAPGQTRPSVKVDAARVDIEGLSLGDLVRTAYRLNNYELGGPDWLETVRFDMQAKDPGRRSAEPDA